MAPMTSRQDSSRNFKYTETAENDIKGILLYTASRFGLLQHRRYAELIDKAASLIAADPMRSGSRIREEVAPGLRSFHLELAAGRRGAAAHVLYYLPGTLDHERAGFVILRILHERMDATRHFADD
jgi:toxin ParE1/3/4